MVIRGEMMEKQLKIKLEEIYKRQKKDEKIARNLLEELEKMSFERADFAEPLERILQSYSCLIERIKEITGERVWYFLPITLHYAEDFALGKTQRNFEAVIESLSDEDFCIEKPTPMDLGALLSFRQHCAIFAIQKTIALGLARIINTPDCLPGYKEYRIKKADFLRAYGLAPKQTKNGPQFSVWERRAAFAALKGLTKFKVWLLYRLKAKGKKAREIISRERPLFNIGVLWQEGVRGKKEFSIEISPIFFDEMSSYYCLVPDNYLEVLRKHGASKYHAQFFLWLFVQKAHKKRLKLTTKDDLMVKIKTKNLAERLRMWVLLKARRETEIRKIITDVTAIARENLWLTSYKYCQETDQHLFTWENDNGK